MSPFDGPNGSFPRLALAVRPHRLSSSVSILFLAAAAFLAASTAPADQGITIGPGIQYSPANVTITPGETITWTWAAAPHSTTSNATSGAEFWDSGIVGVIGTTFSHTFTTPGSYPFYCRVHSFPGGTAMNGVITVAIATPTATATPIVFTPTPTPTITATSVPPSPTPVPTPNPGPSAGGTIPALGGGGRLALVVLLAAIAVTRLLANKR